jgi:hypothetical protein
MEPDNEKDRSHCLVLTAEALVTRFEFVAMLLIGKDEDSRVSVGACGLDPIEVVRLLESAATRIAERHGICRTPVMPEGQETEGYDVAGPCPVCGCIVRGPPQRPELVDDFAAVCECGSFLIPTYSTAGALCGVELMTMERIGSLPDEVRNTLIRLRRNGMCTGSQREHSNDDR